MIPRPPLCKAPNVQIFRDEQPHAMECTKAQTSFREQNSSGQHQRVELRQRLAEHPGLIRQVTSYGSTLRGSRPYWFKRCSELKEMIEAIGTPTLFFTLSAADLWWSELYEFIAPEVDFSTMTSDQAIRTRSKLLRKNLMIGDWFFVHRAYHFIKHVLTPYFEI